MFDNIGEISYYVPEVTSKFGTLLKNEDFLKSLKLEYTEKFEDLIMKNGDIKFNNVSFKYLVIKKVLPPQDFFVCEPPASQQGVRSFSPERCLMSVNALVRCSLRV